MLDEKEFYFVLDDLDICSKRWTWTWPTYLCAMVLCEVRRPGNPTPLVVGFTELIAGIFRGEGKVKTYLLHGTQGKTSGRRVGERNSLGALPARIKQAQTCRRKGGGGVDRYVRNRPTYRNTSYYWVPVSVTTQVASSN